MNERGDRPEPAGGAPAATAPLPQKLGRYAVTRAIGAGGMGAVYAARDEALAREVAIKVVRPGPGFRGAARGMMQRRFENEARAAARLVHPNVVQVFDLGEADDGPYLVMELVDGRSLREVLDQAPRLPPGDVRGLGIQMAQALAAAHRAGILHRDVKPSNILEAAPTQWKLADFGVARVPDSELTVDGQFVGTPSYGAPESIGAGTFLPASDVYSLGAVLYEALTGEWPRRGGMMTVLVASVKAPLPRPRELFPEAPEELEAAIMEALAEDPGARPTALELAVILAGGTGQRPAAPPPPPTEASAPGLVASAPSVPSVPVEHPGARGRSRALYYGIAAAALALLVGIAIGAGSDEDGGDVAASPGAGRGQAPAHEPAGASARPEPAALHTGAGAGAGVGVSPALAPPWPERVGPPRGKKGRGAGKQRKIWAKARDRYERGDVAGALREVLELAERHASPEAFAWLEWAEEAGLISIAR